MCGRAQRECGCDSSRMQMTRPNACARRYMHTVLLVLDQPRPQATRTVGGAASSLSIFVTLETSHESRGWLNEEAKPNNPASDGGGAQCVDVKRHVNVERTRNNSTHGRTHRHTTRHGRRMCQTTQPQASCRGCTVGRANHEVNRRCEWVGEMH